MSEFTAKDLINVNERFRTKPALIPKIDEAVTRAIGVTVYALDPRLLKLIASWKGNKPADSLEPDNFLEDPRKIEQLKQVFCN